MDLDNFNETINETIYKRLVDLIKINTTKSSNNNMEAITYLREELNKIGVSNEIYEPYSGNGNLIATIEGEQNSNLVLCSHIDTEEIYDLSKWRNDPFEPTIDSDIIYGRGSIDCKGLVALWLGVVIQLKREGLKPKKTLRFIVDSDEETGGSKGIGWLLNNTNIFEDTFLVLSEGGGFPLKVNDTTYITVQTGEREYLKILKDDEKILSYLRSNNKYDIEEGIRKNAYNMNTLEYFNLIKKTCIDDDKRKINIENFRDYMYEHDTKFINIYKLPYLDSNDLFTRSEIINHVKTGQVSNLDDFLDLIQNEISKIDKNYKILPFVTPGYSDNRYFRMKGIKTLGFFPLDIENKISGIHGYNEYITKKSLDLAFQVLYSLVKKLVL